jgi:hypothetical protein
MKALGLTKFGGAVDHGAVLRAGGLATASRYRGGLPAALPARNASSRPVRSTAPGLLRRAEPEGELQPGRPADLLGQEPADAAPVDPADQLPDQVPIEQRRLAVRGPGQPRWRGLWSRPGQSW